MASKTDTKVVQGIRLHDLAKEIGVPSKDLLDKCKALNIGVKNHASTLTRGQADRLRAKLADGEEVRAEIEKHTRVVTASKVTTKVTPTKTTRLAKRESPTRALGKGTRRVTPAKLEPEEAVSPAEEAAPPPEAELGETAAPEFETPPEAAPAEEAALEQPVEVKIEPPLPPPEAVVETEAPSDQAPAPAPKVIQAGPELAPPIKRTVKPPTDSRFGVVISAEEARKLHGGPAQQARAPRAAGVESQRIEEFKAQVTYPSLPTEAEAEEQRRRSGGRAARVAGNRQGPRHGHALLQTTERYRKSPQRKKSRGLAKPVVPRSGPAEVTSPVSIRVLCEALGIKATELIKKFFLEGKTVQINDVLTDEDAELYAAEFDPLRFGIKIKKARDVEEEMLASTASKDTPEELTSRAPVVTIMGHVDHGKTSLLDYIRKTQVAAGEAGGITQHIAAYRVETSHGPICFLDTPGHRAFTEMRARGAVCTDIVVLVVAANDGVMPQTEEAISHARAAERRIIVALNKIDLPEANPDKVKGELASKGVYVEGYGGEVGCQEVSAKTGKGVKELLERIALEAEMMDLKANPAKRAVGTVIEAHKDPGRGIVTTLLVQEGTLRQGDVIIAAHCYGTVRQLLDHREKALDEAGPAVPVLVTGLNDVPLAGERFHVLEDIKFAAQIASKRAMDLRLEGLSARHHVSLENLADMLAQGDVAALKIVLKVDVVGSLNPIQSAVSELSNQEVKVEILHSGVGGINETDIQLADASDAVVIGFHVAADPGARRMAEERGVEIRTYEIIYDLIDEIRKGLEGLLKPLEEETITGHVEIRQTFKISKVGTVAGCFVTDGSIGRNSQIRLIRDGKPVWTGSLESLKRVKDDAREVQKGFECGLKLAGFNDVKVGDLIEAYKVEKRARALDGSVKR